MTEVRTKAEGEPVQGSSAGPGVESAFFTEQHTLAAEVSFEGPGLHTGRVARAVVGPSDPGSGIVFRRIDRRGRSTEIPASWSNTVDVPLCQTLQGADGVRLTSVEHLLAALWACQIDNAIVEVFGDEVPVLDGSAGPFVRALSDVGLQPQRIPRRFLRILKPVFAAGSDRRVSLEPAAAGEIGLAVDLTIRLVRIGALTWCGSVTPDVLREELAEARTFGRLRAWHLAAAVLGRWVGPPMLRGASRETVLVIVGDRVLNRGGLRMPDEFVRHRVVDAVGDLALAGAPIIGRFTAHDGTAHRAVADLLRTLFASSDAYAFETVEPD